MKTRPSAKRVVAAPLKRISLPRPHFVGKTIKDSRGRRRKYVVYVPAGYKPNRAWPAILYLHGIGERGTDGRKQCSIGIGPAIIEFGRLVPFIVMFPQCIEFDRTDDDLAMAILDRTCNEYRINPARIYLTGLSMGGAGTWRLATRYPDRFAAIAPICGRSLPGRAAKLMNTPVWCFHGDADPVIPVAESRRMIAALRALGARPRYTEYPGILHNSWDRAYATRGLYAWLLRHRCRRREGGAGSKRGGPQRRADRISDVAVSVTSRSSHHLRHRHRSRSLQ
jgi:predicted peptidase